MIKEHLGGTGNWEGVDGGTEGGKRACGTFWGWGTRKKKKCKYRIYLIIFFKKMNTFLCPILETLRDS